jgi:hypothetical protein
MNLHERLGAVAEEPVAEPTQRSLRQVVELCRLPHAQTFASGTVERGRHTKDGALRVRPRPQGDEDPFERIGRVVLERPAVVPGERDEFRQLDALVSQFVSGHAEEYVRHPRSELKAPRHLAGMRLRDHRSGIGSCHDETVLDHIRSITPSAATCCPGPSENTRHTVAPVRAPRRVA